MMNRCMNGKEEKLSEKQNAIDKMAAEIFAQMDFDKATTTVFIRDSGDWSRYHETVSLQFRRQEWSLLENYLTPEYSFVRRVSLPSLDRSNAKAWIKALLSQNEVLLDTNRGCPKDGLLLPDEICCPE